MVYNVCISVVKKGNLLKFFDSKSNAKAYIEEYVKLTLRFTEGMSQSLKNKNKKKILFDFELCLDTIIHNQHTKLKTNLKKLTKNEIEICCEGGSNPRLICFRAKSNKNKGVSECKLVQLRVP